MATLDTFDPVGAFQRGRRGQQLIAAEESAAPRRNQLADLQLEQAQVGAQRQTTQFDQQQALQRAKVLGQSAQALLGLDPSQRASALQAVAPELQRFGIDASQFPSDQLTDENLKSVIAQAQGFAIDPSTLTAGQREFAAQTKGLSEADVTKAKRIDLGLDPRAGISAAERIANDPALSGKVAESVGEQAGAKEGAKLAKQLKLKPAVEAAVVTAVAEAKSAAAAIGEQKSNNATLNLYDTAMSALVTALGGTTTGPAVGWLPAVTANAQIAEGAIAAIAPVLKQLFRSAGEGIFTDKDQELLLKMIPTRKTSPSARVSILENIDAIVRAKLKQPAGQPQQVGRFTIEAE